MTTATTTIAVRCECIKMIPTFFCQIGKMYSIFCFVLADHRISGHVCCEMKGANHCFGALSEVPPVLISKRQEGGAGRKYGVCGYTQTYLYVAILVVF